MTGDQQQAGRTGDRGRLFLTFLGLLCACAAVRVWVIARQEAISRDGTIYIRMAREWAGDPGAVVRKYDYHVGYPLAILGVHKLLAPMGAGDGREGWERAGQLVCLVSALAATVALWWFAGMTFGWRIAWIISLVFTCTRKWAYLGGDVLSDSLAMALETWAVVLALLALRKLRQGRWQALPLALGVGLCAGAGYQVRPEALAPVLVAVALWVAYQFRARMNRRLTAGAVLVAALSAALVAAPYMTAIGGLTKKKQMPGLAQVADQAPPLAQVAGASSAVPIRALLSQLVEAMHPVLFFLSVIWLAAWLGKRLPQLKPVTRPLPLPAGPPTFVALCAVAIMAPVLMTLQATAHYLSYRHAMFLGMMFMPSAGAGGIILMEWLSMPFGRHKDRARQVLTALGMVAAIAGMFTQTLRPMHEGSGYFRQAAGYLAEVAGADDYVLANNSWLLHYSQVKGECIPAVDFTEQQVMNWVRDGSPAVTYLALSDRDLEENKPPLLLHLNPPAFWLVRAFPQTAQKDPDTVRIYRVDRSVPTATAPGR